MAALTPLRAQITVSSTQQFASASGSGLKAVTGLGTFDAAGADKLVVVGLHRARVQQWRRRRQRGPYNGIRLTEVVQEEPVDRGTAAIFYLDNPGAIARHHRGLRRQSERRNRRRLRAVGKPPASAPPTAAGSSVTSVSLTTTGDNSLVIAVIDNAGKPNAPALRPPSRPHPCQQRALGQPVGQSRLGLPSQVASPATVTPTFTTNTGAGRYSINLAAAEFLAASGTPTPLRRPSPPPTSWTTREVVPSLIDSVTYTVTFSEPMKASTLNTDDFDERGAAARHHRQRHPDQPLRLRSLGHPRRGPAPCNCSSRRVPASKTSAAMPSTRPLPLRTTPPLPSTAT